MNTYLNQYIFTLGVILLLIIILGVIFWKRRKEPDYFAFFTMGIFWFFIGISMENCSLSIMGFIFLIAGLVNKKKWKKPEDSWKNLTKDQKRIKTLFMVALGLLIIAGMIAWFLLAKY
jgi:LPXTG-motif cell wall-anchored protein